MMGAVVLRTSLTARIATGRSHRSVWYSRCSSRARGSIDEI
jgi:hypothetical protein